MKITVATPDISEACTARAYMLAKMLQDAFEVEIVGPLVGSGVWATLAEDQRISYRFCKLEKGFKSFSQLNDLSKELDGDLILAIKPLLTSFGVGLFKKVVNQVPLILDCDDWVWGLKKAQYNDLYASRALFLMRTFLGRDAFITYANALLQGCLTPYADAITVSSSFLQRKYGGELIHQAVDTCLYDPRKFNRLAIRDKYDIAETDKVVVFSGNPGPHKGVEDLVDAMHLIKKADIKLFVVGINNSEYCCRLVRQANTILGSRFVGLPFRPFQQAPECLMMADVVAIPQRHSPASVGQTPMKLFDAMAMAKPVVTTDVADIGEILGDCGWIVEPGNSHQLALAIENVFMHPYEAAKKADKAREKCLKNHSMDVVGKKLIRTVRELM